MKNQTLQKVAFTGVLAALSYVLFTFVQIKIPLPGGDATSIHIANTVCVLGALLLGGTYGGLAGAIGMTFADLMDPIYVIYAPKTFLLKLCIGLITGFVAHRIFNITKINDKQKLFLAVCLSSSAGLLFNVIFDPLIGYYYKLFILGKPAADITLAWNITATGINAFTSIIISVFLYLALLPALKKSGLFFQIRQVKKDNQA